MRNPFQKKTNQDVWLKAGAGLGAALLAGIFAWLSRDEILEILEFLKGKSFAVLGERKVGKTVLINFLTKGKLPKDYIQTLDPVGTKPNYFFKLNKLNLKIKESKDVPGAPDFYDQWKDIVQNADIVLYLLRSDKLKAGDKYTEERVKRDMDQIGEWLKQNPEKIPLFVIGTHCDLTTPDLTKLPKDKRGDYEDELRGMPIFEEIKQRGSRGGQIPMIFFGSLKSEETTEDLVGRIIGQVVSHNG